MNWTVEVIIFIVLAISVAFDALRDAGVRRLEDWWPWHIKKWLGYYPSYIVFIIYFLEYHDWKILFIVGIAVYSCACWAIWKISYYIGTRGNSI